MHPVARAAKLEAQSRLVRPESSRASPPLKSKADAEYPHRPLTACLWNCTGAANIVEKNADAPRSDKEHVPQEAIRPSMDDQDHHVGRGGAGNEHHAPGHEHHHHKDKTPEEGGLAKDGPKGLADKLKAKVMGVFKK